MDDNRIADDPVVRHHKSHNIGRGGVRSIFPSTMPAYRRNHRLTLDIIDCDGGGKRGVLSKDDRDAPTKSITTNVLTVRSHKGTTAQKARAVRNQMCDKTVGFGHEEAIVLEGVRYGKYSYRFITDKTTQELAEYFQESPIFKIDRNKSYEEGNVRVNIVLINGGEKVPMGAVFSEQDIVNLCAIDDNQSGRWR